MALAIANRYAVALAEVVTKPASAVSPEAALEQLVAIRRLLEESQPLRNVLHSPAVGPAEKRALIASLCARMEVSNPVRNFLFVVIDHRRTQFIGEMIDAFRAWLDEKAGVARIEVASAQSIDEPRRDAIVEKFHRVTGRQVRAAFRVVPELVGGATVRYGSTVFDGSIRAQLEALDRAITGEA